MEPVLSAESRRRLSDALGEAQRIGMLGQEPLDSVIDRSLGFVKGIPDGTGDVIDLGSGGGDPGLVIAMYRPDVSVTLVDRRAKRTDLLSRLVGRLGLADRVEVVEADAALLPRRYPGRHWDVVTSRGFGSPAYTAAHASGLLRNGGVMLVSEPPDSNGDRWRIPEVESLGLFIEVVENGVARLVKKS
ncbi:MAG: RsmG family class I SAM-dependent methyltransferase [Actinomycetota bacterium]